MKFFLLAAAFSVAAHAQKAVPLFDGKSLDGWAYNPAIWRVENGVVVGGSKTEKIKKNHFVSTERSFSNFELNLKIRCSGDPKTGLINSGIQIRSVPYDGYTHMSGYQVDCGNGWFGKIYDEGRRNKVIAEPVDSEAVKKSVDIFGWNTYRIRAEGPRIRVWINDVLVTDFEESNPHIALDGKIGIQVHSGGIAMVEFKDISVTELPPTPNAPTWESLGGVKEAVKKAKPAPRKKKPTQGNIPSPPKGKGRISFDFESGDLQGWFVASGWFGHPVAKNERIRNGGRPMNKEGEFYLGTLEVEAGGAASDGQTGVLESPVFKLTGPKISFAVSGGDHENTYVGLYTLDGKEVRKAKANNSEVFGLQTWDVAEFVGKAVFVRLVDQNSGSWGHIVLDAFSAEGEILEKESKARLALAKPGKPKAKPKRRAGKKTQSVRTEAWSPEKQLAGFTVPPGFVVELVASEEHGVVNPIDLAFDAKGRLWTQTARMYPLDPIAGIKWGALLKLMDDEEKQKNYPEFQRIRDLYQLKRKGNDQILILDDLSKAVDGPLHVWADGLSIPQSILPYKDGAYVCHGSELFLLRDVDGDGKSDKMEPVLTGFGFTDTHTMAHLLIRGPGSYIHFSQGALNKGTVTAVASGKQHRIDAACQVRFGLDHQDFEVISSGPNNMWGLQLRANGEWYGTEANDLGYSIMPWEHGAATKGVARKPIRPYQPMLPVLHKFRVGGTGISAMEFSDDSAGSFPAEEWKNVALLGNAITSTINAVRIHRNPDGTVEAEHLEDFLQSEDDWFRPVNMEFGPDGCLYVADFYNKIVSHNEVTTEHPDRDKTHGRIWRIRHESQPAREIPDLTQAKPRDLLGHLKSSTLWEKRSAWHQIADRQLREIAPDLVQLAGDEKTDSVTRIHALWCLEELRHFDASLMDALLKSETDDLRREAVRALASFDLESAAVASQLGSALEDENCMVRSQAIRTLGDVNDGDPAVLSLLISACKPALAGNALGGAYERNLERYLARLALEKTPDALQSYLAVSIDKHQPENILWAIQVLGGEAKKQIFVAIWDEASKGDLDSETFVAICSMLDSPEIANILKPLFEKKENAKHLVLLALTNQSRVQSKAFIQILTPSVKHLLAASKTSKLGLNAVSKFRILAVSKEVAALKLFGSDDPVLHAWVYALGIDPKRNKDLLAKVAGDQSTRFDIRLDALKFFAAADSVVASDLAVKFLSGVDSAKQGEVVKAFSDSKSGCSLLIKLVSVDVISEEAFDLSSAENMIRMFSSDPTAKEVHSIAVRRAADQRKKAQARIHELIKFIGKNPGNVAKGQATFASCLACHQVGSEGQNIAPALDGSGHRDLEHLLTAIVDPDAAVESGYGLYRITKSDGSTVEGYLDKEEDLGKTVAMMGGARVFVANEEILKSGYVGRRSFMPAAFGQLPSETMADLVAYIQTLKEGEPEN
ncbi:MAG: PVC-type heme-binding CxxCH protein [Akkermansiaceae bacterium]